MDLSILSKEDLYSTLTFTLNCAKTINEQDMQKILDGMREQCSFEYAVLSLVDVDTTNTEVKNLTNHSYPEEWVECYMSNSFYQLDPVIMHAKKHKMPFMWRDIVPEDQKSNGLVFEAASDYGLQDGMSCAYGGVSRSNLKTLVSISGSKRRIQEVYERMYIVVSLILPLLHDVNITTFFKYKTNLDRVNLTNRERDVIAWTADGKSVEEIGKILSISQDTVKYHIKNLYEKLNAVNKYHAVSNALRLGLI